VQRAGEKWTSNLKATTKRRSPDVKHELNKIKCEMPSNRDSIGRFLELFNELNGQLDQIT